MARQHYTKYLSMTLTDLENFFNNLIFKEKKGEDKVHWTKQLNEWHNTEVKTWTTFTKSMLIPKNNYDHTLLVTEKLGNARHQSNFGILKRNHFKISCSEASPHQLTVQLILFYIFNWQIPYRKDYLSCIDLPILSAYSTTALQSPTTRCASSLCCISLS